MHQSAMLGSRILDAVEQLILRFQNAPVLLERRSESLVVSPTLEPSFSITAYNEGDEVMIAAERWHSHYNDPEQAAFCVMWMLTPYYRVVHEFKGALIAAAWLECYGNSGWEAFDPAFFLNPEVESEWNHEGDWVRIYNSQAILPSPWPYTTVAPSAVLDGNGLPLVHTIGSCTEAGPQSIGLTLF